MPYRTINERVQTVVGEDGNVYTFHFGDIVHYGVDPWLVTIEDGGAVNPAPAQVGFWGKLASLFRRS